MRKFIHKITIALIASVPMAIPLPVVAQSVSTKTANSTYVCMSRKSNSRDQHENVIVMPASHQTTMSGRGYASRACVTDQAAFLNYRTQICQIADKASVPFQNQFTRTHGVSPREMCDMANAAAVQ